MIGKVFILIYYNSLSLKGSPFQTKVRKCSFYNSHYGHESVIHSKPPSQSPQRTSIYQQSQDVLDFDDAEVDRNYTSIICKQCISCPNVITSLHNSVKAKKCLFDSTTVENLVLLFFLFFFIIAITFRLFK